MQCCIMDYINEVIVVNGWLFDIKQFDNHYMSCLKSSVQHVTWLQLVLMQGWPRHFHHLRDNSDTHSTDPHLMTSLILTKPDWASSDDLSASESSVQLLICSAAGAGVWSLDPDLVIHTRTHAQTQPEPDITLLISHDTCTDSTRAR